MTKRRVLWVLLLFALAACGRVGPTPAGPTPVLPTKAPAVPPTRTFVPVPTRDPRLPTDTPIPTVPWPALPELARWEGGYVSSLAWFPDGRQLAVTTSDGLLLADGVTLARLDILLPRTPAANVEVARDGSLIAVAVTDTAQLWSPAGTGWQSRRLMGGGGKVFGVALSPDNALLAAGEVSGTVRVWDVQQGAQVQVWSAHQGEVFDVTFSADGTLLATAGRDGFVRLWRVGTWEPAGSFQHADVVRGIAFSSDGRLLAAASFDSTVGVWDVASGQEVHALRGHIAQVNCVSFSPDGWLLASGGMDGTMRVWDVATGKTVAWSEDHIDPVSGVGFAPDGRTIASGGWDRTVRLWDASIVR